jgi:hypothetical protein
MISDAFKRGYNAFLYGDKVLATLTPNQETDILNRLRAIRWGDMVKAERLAVKLFLSGITLVDIYNSPSDAYPCETEGYKSVEPSNPYRSETLLYKEWQRGVNSAYFNNLNMIHMIENNVKGKHQ